MSDHRAIIVCGYNPRALRQARDYAMKLFGKTTVEVTQTSTRGVNGFASFMISPDGNGGMSLAGLASDRLRRKMLEWLEKVGNVEHAWVQWGHAALSTGRPERNWYKLSFEALSKGEQETLRIIARAINKQLIPDPPIAEATDFDEMLDVDLIDEFYMDDVDLTELLVELQLRLPVTLLDFGKDFSEETSSVTMRNLLERACYSLKGSKPVKRSRSGRHRHSVRKKSSQKGK